MAESRGPILVVDDIPANLTAFEAVLDGLGAPLVKAGSGQEALHHLLKSDFAVILLDVRMPEMDGIETARYVRMGQRSKSTPILFVTAGDGDLEDALRGYSAGAVDYIKKPVRAEILRSKVRVFLELYEKEKELARKADDLEKANQELRTACRDLEIFTYAVAHEFRAPLRAMSGFCEILRDQYAGRPFDLEGLEFARRIEGGSRRLDALIRDLLSYCAVARTRVETAPVPVDPVIREALRSLEPELQSKKAEVSADDGFPSVLAHRPLFGIALTALLSNALKFVAEGVRPRIQIGHEARHGRIRIWVQDNGLGIPPEHLDRIFGVFERLHNSPEIPGTGMGLAIARAAAERMGAQVGVDSEPGRGSRFWMEFPGGRTRPEPGRLERAQAIS
jgi:two-component system sensor histidine kinase/response regulator